MKDISRAVDLSKQCTNNSIRATAVTVLDPFNFEARHIMRVTGHKSEASIRSYSRRLSENKQREISETLGLASVWIFVRKGKDSLVFVFTLGSTRTDV